MAPWLARRGFLLDVLTTDPERLPARDESSLAELAAGTRVFGVREKGGWHDWLDGVATRASTRRRAGASSPAQPAPQRAPQADSVAPDDLRWLFNRRGASRAYTAWLMRRRELDWALEAARAGVRLAASERYAAVISCGPPHQAHEAARRVSAATGAPLVLDLRDPWALRRRLPSAYASPLYFHFADRDERRAAHHARLIIANTEPLRRAMQAAYPDRRVITVMNGYDEEPLPDAGRPDRFRAAYAGSIYLDRDPRPLLNAFARLVRERSLTPDQATLEFMGSVSGYGGSSLEQLAQQAGIGGYLKVHPRAPRPAALRFLASAPVLVSLPQDSPLAIPSKIFEYMQFPAWLLVLATADSPAGQLLAGTDAAAVDPADGTAIAQWLLRHYDAWASGQRPHRLDNAHRWSRQAQSDLLATALEDVARR